MFVLSFVRSRVFVAPLLFGIVLLVAIACGGDDGGEDTPTAGQTPTGGGATAEISMIPTMQFDREELTIPADTEVTITVNNDDTGIPHSFAVYSSRDAAESGEDALAATDTCTGSCTDTVTLTLAAGEYFFRCDVHPAQMTGTLVVE